jgi:alpha-beta hydrolase superfamily lysophospholipase
MVIVAGGLNTRAEALDPLIHFLNDAGLECARVSFTFGHSFDPDEIAAVWIAQIADAYYGLRSRETSPHLFTLGYSLGGIVSLAFLQQNPEGSFDRMFLVAPPLGIRPSARLIRALTPLHKLRISLPSLQPAKTRERRFTTLADYAAMMNLLDGLDRTPPRENMRGTPTHVFLSARDEMVDPGGVERWIRRHRLPWQTRIVQNVAPSNMPHHLLLSEETMGNEAWGWLTDDVLRTFT